MVIVGEIFETKSKKHKNNEVKLGSIREEQMKPID